MLVRHGGESDLSCKGSSGAGWRVDCRETGMDAGRLVRDLVVGAGRGQLMQLMAKKIMMASLTEM